MPAAMGCSVMADTRRRGGGTVIRRWSDPRAARLISTLSHAENLIALGRRAVTNNEC
jgi:hypothetical protein